MDKVLEGVRHCVIEDMNQNLLALFSKDEILVALKGIGATKAARNDGFSAIYFQ